MGWTRARMEKVARRTGYPVVAAWAPNHHGPMGTVLGPMLHHTATPNSYLAKADIPTLKVLREGRADLTGPLCNYGLGRKGAIYLVSEGRANHAGPGRWKGGVLGSTCYLGIEAENGGRGAKTDPWPDEQLDAYQRLVASIVLETGRRDVDYAIRHADWAIPLGRKIDAAGFDMDEFDAVVLKMLRAPLTINKNYKPGQKPPVPAKPPVVTTPKFPLPTGYVFGPRTGPKSQVSGYYSHRADLARWERRMKDRGWTISVNGLYDDQTRRVALQFQKQCGIRQTGLINDQTWNKAWTAKIT